MAADLADDAFATGAAIDDFGADAAVDLDTEEAGLDTGDAPATASDDPYETLYKHHPETIIRYAESIDPLIPLKAAPPGTLDERHVSPPFLTVYERTKILGTRANQIADGARPFINPAAIPVHITQPLDIAKLELEQRLLPFIIERPMPDGTFEYWRLSDLLML
jgi:DNA-directed RNA polymerase subunit K/omega